MITNMPCLLALYRASNRNTPSTWVLVAGVGVLFSYQAPVAFYYGSKRFRREERFSNTTARHMRKTEMHRYTPLDEYTFVSELNSAIAKSVLNAVTHQVEA